MGWARRQRRRAHPIPTLGGRWGSGHRPPGFDGGPDSCSGGPGSCSGGPGACSGGPGACSGGPWACSGGTLRSSTGSPLPLPLPLASPLPLPFAVAVGFAVAVRFVLDLIFDLEVVLPVGDATSRARDDRAEHAAPGALRDGRAELRMAGPDGLAVLVDRVAGQCAVDPLGGLRGLFLIRVLGVGLLWLGCFLFRCLLGAGRFLVLGKLDDLAVGLLFRSFLLGGLVTASRGGMRVAVLGDGCATADHQHRRPCRNEPLRCDHGGQGGTDRRPDAAEERHRSASCVWE
jgi:hypothetical protein